MHVIHNSLTPNDGVFQRTTKKPFGEKGESLNTLMESYFHSIAIHLYIQILKTVI